MSNTGNDNLQDLWDNLITAVNAVASIDCAIEQLRGAVGKDNADVAALSKAALAVKQGLLAGSHIKIQ